MYQNDIHKFTGKVALVTGAASGIGLVTARLFAEQNARVILIDRDRDQLEVAMATLDSEKVLVDAYVCDIRLESDVNTVVDVVCDKYDRIDIVANLAGVYPISPYNMEELGLDEWHSVHQVNLDGSFILARAVLPHMRRNMYGRIINTSSVATTIAGMKGISPYMSSKAAVIGLTRAIAFEAGSDGITANVVMPGLIETERTRASTTTKGETDAVFDSFIERQCVKRRGKSEDVAYCISFLASDEASFITGQTININGGIYFGS